MIIHIGPASLSAMRLACGSIKATRLELFNDSLTYGNLKRRIDSIYLNAPD